MARPFAHLIGRIPCIPLKVFLFFTGVGLGLLSYAQDSEVDTPQPGMVASATKMNILYRGIDNPVDVAVPGVPCEQLRVTITNGELTGEGCRYMISPGGGYVVWLKATWPTPDGLDSSRTPFKVRNIPQPHACFGGTCMDYDSLLVSHAKAARGVIARLLDMQICLSLRVAHYRLRLLRNCQIIFDGISSEAQLSEPMFNALHDVRGEDTIIIDEVKVKYPDGIEREALPLHLFVK